MISLINGHLDNQSPANHQIRSFSGTATRSPWPNTDVAIRCNRIFLSRHHQQQLMKFVKTEYILIAHMTSTLLYPSLCWNDAEMINTKTQRSSGWAIKYQMTTQRNLNYSPLCTTSPKFSPAVWQHAVHEVEINVQYAGCFSAAPPVKCPITQKLIFG